jgi:hypothetical protein
MQVDEAILSIRLELSIPEGLTVFQGFFMFIFKIYCEKEE